MDKNLTKLLELLKDMHPEDNTSPNHNYETKKILHPMGMGYIKMRAYHNDCIIYRKEYEKLN